MTVGMFLASMAFVAAAIVQVDIDVSCLLILQWPLLVGRGGTSSSRTETVRGARQGLAGEAGPGAVGSVPFQSACPAGSYPCRARS